MTTGYSPHHNSVAHKYARQAGRYTLRIVLLLLALLLVSVPLGRSLKHAYKGRGPDPAAATGEFAPRQLGLRELR